MWPENFVISLTFGQMKVERSINTTIDYETCQLLNILIKFADFTDLNVKYDH